ncbi:MAG TPA: hypothetical protein VN723_12995 [Rhizomicrobium sp.]|nr:hypothetical protein [Rhizomicrobium sp.]
MPGRSSFTTSERELIMALAEDGRPITLANLAGWRKEGLLPPLASQGLGTGKGRAYYWKEPNIRDHACATFDLLRKYGRPEIVLWMLWLHGFSVPLRQFRRAWAARSRNRVNWMACPTPKYRLNPDTLFKLAQPGLQGQGDTTYILLQATLALSGTLVPDDGDAAAITRVIERALTWISRTNGLSTPEDDQAAERLWLTVRIVCTALEGSDLVSITGDAGLREAQKYLLMTGQLLQKCDDRSLEDGETTWPTWLAERMAVPAFLLILVMLRSGYKPMLDEIAARLDKPNRRHFPPPVQPAYSTL